MEEPPSERDAEEPSVAGTPSEQRSDEPSRTSLAKTPTGTPVGVDDPYEHVDRCDHCTDDGRCRFAFERFEADPSFARDRRDDGYRCPVVREPSGGDRSDGADGADWEEWADCPNFASTTDGKECRRCGLEERRMAHADVRALIEEHHLSYAGDRTDPDDGDAVGSGDAAVGTDDGAPDPGASDADPAHEITVALCRWCHAKVHKSWARVDDDVSPDPEAIAAREQRRGEELEEASFQSAAERFGGDEE